MADMKNVLKEVLKEITPKDRKLILESDKVVKEVNAQLKKDKIKASAVKGGSIAKETNLIGDADCDIFVKFNNSHNSYEISGILKKSMSKLFKDLQTLHGSRDYYLHKNDLSYEIVPVIDIKAAEAAKNVTDCSPLHTLWVNKFPKLKNDIRLAKAFAKSAKVYGAESYIGGFSGHVIDILTIYYGGFEKLLKGSLKWKEGEVLDINNYHRGMAKFNLNTSKTASGIILIDPIDPHRNAAAALSTEKMKIFQKKAGEFLKKPIKKFFIKEEFNLENIKYDSKKEHMIVIDIISEDGKHDVIGAKILKTYEFTVTKLKENEFVIKKSGWNWDKDKTAVIYLIIDKKKLPKDIIRQGPPLMMKESVFAFKKKNKNTFVKSKKIFAKIKRKYNEPQKLLVDLIKDEYVKERVKSISIRK